MEAITEEIVKKVKTKKIVSRTIMMLISLLMSALIYNIFLLPTNLVTGGVNGIATITNYVYGIEPSVMIFLVSIACLILSFMYLGVERTVGTLVATLLYPVFIELTSFFTKNIYIDTSDLLVISIFIGIIGGIANGLMYKTGFSNGGLPIISQILSEYFKIPLSKSILAINTIIVLIGGVFFGPIMVMYAIIILYINSIMIGKVLLGISNNKAFYIVTTEEKEVKDYIINKMKHSVTIFDVKGAFLEKKRKVLLTVIPTKEYFRVTEGIKMIDSKAFFVATDAYEVAGGK